MKKRSTRKIGDSLPSEPSQNLEEIVSSFRSALLGQITRRLKSLARKYGAYYVGIGKPHRGGNLVERSPLHIRFYVTRKLKRIKKKQVIPKALTLRIVVLGKRKIIKVPTDVVVAPSVQVLATQAGRIAYIYNKNDPDEQGSGGAIVRAQSNQDTYLLTAGHVAARNRKVIDPVLGEEIFRELSIPLGLLKCAPRITKVNPLDTALVSIEPSGYKDVVARLSGEAVQDVRTSDSLHTEQPEDFVLLPWHKEKTMKFVAVVYDMPVPRVYAAGDVIFTQLLEFEGNAEFGDSGAIMVDKDNCAVGLHVLGNQQSGSSFCIPMRTVLDNTLPGDGLTLIY